MRIGLWGVTLLCACASLTYAQTYDHDKYIVSGFVAYHYIGCEDGNEIDRVFRDYDGTVTRSAEAALALRGCVFVDKGDLVRLEAPAESVVINGREVKGYYISTRSELAPVVWFPYAFLTKIDGRLKDPPPPPEPEVEPDLFGPLPVGRWSVWRFFNPEHHVKSNIGWYDHYEYQMELTADGLGHKLLFYGERRPKGGFRFPAMGQNVWTRDEELSWQWVDGQDSTPEFFVLRTTYETIYLVSTATQDFISMTETRPGRENTLWPHGRRFILARLGSGHLLEAKQVQPMRQRKQGKGAS